MKVVVAFNRNSQNVINLFGQPNREKIGLQQIKRITDALKAGGHQVEAIESDKDLVARLEDFMPRVVTGERPGLVLNLSYGIQGQARYTHVPSILEMMGVPYVGSGPLAHSIALDKVVTKILLRQHGLPTPDFAVLEDPEDPVPDLIFPLIVKPRDEAVSFGLRIVNSPEELRAGARDIFDAFGRGILVERYIDGREINVGVLGNDPPETLPPVELSFGEGGPKIYRYEDKTGKSGRSVQPVCPAPLEPELSERIQELAVRAFNVVGCVDCARVDLRLDQNGSPYILEINSLPSLGPRGSYVAAAKVAGLDFPELVNRLVEIASARYFGTPTPPVVTTRSRDPEASVVNFLSQRRDRIEQRLAYWCGQSSRSSDAIGLDATMNELSRTLEEIGLSPVDDLSDDRAVRTWQSKAGLEGGTLLVGHLDVPVPEEVPGHSFRREPEWFYGEGIGTSRAPMVVLEYALRALRSARLLRERRIGVTYYRDEGSDMRYSRDLVAAAMRSASRVLILRPGGANGALVHQRRGQKRFRLTVEGTPAPPGRTSKRTPPLVWLSGIIPEIHALTSSKDRVSVSLSQLSSDAFPMLLPHRVTATLLITYVEPEGAQRAEAAVRQLLGRNKQRWSLEAVSDRPPMKKRAAGVQLAKSVAAIAEKWELPVAIDSSVWPSAGGWAPTKTPTLCGWGPEARDLYTPQESIRRISLMQRTLLLATTLAGLDRQSDEPK